MPRAAPIKTQHFWLFLLTCTVFLWINQDGFKLGYFGEDYMWLYRSERSSFWQAMLPTGGFYRPLAVNLPYYLFSHLGNGLYLWKLTALLVTFAGYLVFWLWLTELTGKDPLAFSLATLWLFHPSNAYGIYYANAFDYVLSAPLLIFLLFALERRAWKAALALLAAACLTKELAFGFPLLFWLRRKELPRRALVAAVAVPVLLAVLHRGFTGGQVGGFTLSPAPRDVYKQFVYLAGQTFFGASSRAWHAFAWLVWLAGTVFLLRSGNRPALRRSAELLAVTAALFLPLTLLANVLTRDLGPIYWVPLLASAGLGLQFATPRFRRHLSGPRIVLLSMLISACSPYVRRYNTQMAETHKRFLAMAGKRLAACGLFDRVVLAGMETIDPFPDVSEWLTWGLMRKFPEVRFYLLSPPSGHYESPHYPLLWVDEWQAKGHPLVRVTKVGGTLRVSEPAPPCLGKWRVKKLFESED